MRMKKGDKTNRNHKRKDEGFMLPQAKMLEVRTRIPECVSLGSTFQRFVAQVRYSRPRKVLPRKKHIRNLRPTFSHPERRFWKDEQKMQCGFSKHFSMVRCPHLSILALESVSKRRSQFFVLPSKIFVWGVQIHYLGSTEE